MSSKGKDHESSFKLSIAIEYFQLASLLIDDLPCMDDAYIRRGSPCLHTKFGDAETILTALGFINKSYSLIWDILKNYPSEISSKASKLIEDSLGVNGLLLGQSLDLNFTPNEASKNSITKIADKKTGSLFRLSIELPAILSGANNRELHYLHRLTKFFGRLYQALDDYKDIKSNNQNKSSRDQIMNRPNLVLNIGEENFKDYLTRMFSISNSIINLLEKESNSWAFFRKLLDQIARHHLVS